MTTLVILVGLLVLAGGLAFWVIKDQQHLGQKVEKAKELETQSDQNRKAKAARDRLKSDPAYAKRLRDRFTR